MKRLEIITRGEETIADANFVRRNFITTEATPGKKQTMSADRKTASRKLLAKANHR